MKTDMKNIFGKNEDLKLFNEQDKKVYEYKVNSTGYSYEYTYDKHGLVLTLKDSYGYWEEYTRDEKGNELNYKNSTGFWQEYTYDKHSRVLTYKDSKGITRGFDIPEYTMEELVERLGNFKLIKKK